MIDGTGLGTRDGSTAAARGAQLTGVTPEAAQALADAVLAWHQRRGDAHLFPEDGYRSCFWRAFMVGYTDAASSGGTMSPETCGDSVFGHTA